MHLKSSAKIPPNPCMSSAQGTKETQASLNTHLACGKVGAPTGPGTAPGWGPYGGCS